MRRVQPAALIIEDGGQSQAASRPLSLCGTAPFAAKLAKIVSASPERAMCHRLRVTPCAPELFLPPT